MRFAPLALLPTFVTSLSSAAPVPDAAASPATEVRYEGDRLTVTSNNASLSEVLDVLRRETGADIRGGELETAPVNQRFEQVPLRDALEHYLGWRSFMLHYADGRLRSIDLLPSAPDQPKAPAAVPAAAPSQPRAPAAVPAAARSPAAAPGATVLGRPRATWQPPAQPPAQGGRAATPPAQRAGAAGSVPAPVASSQPATGETRSATRLGRPWPQAAFTTPGRPNAASAMRGRPSGR